MHANAVAARRRTQFASSGNDARLYMDDGCVKLCVCVCTSAMKRGACQPFELASHGYHGYSTQVAS
jgi:hypothetical protein